MPVRYENTSGAVVGIGGTIAAHQVAFGTGADTIGGSNSFKWNSGAVEFEVPTINSLTNTVLRLHSDSDILFLANNNNAAGTTRYQWDSKNEGQNIMVLGGSFNGLWLSPEVQTFGSPFTFKTIAAAHTTLNNTEVNDIYFKLDRTVQFIGGGAPFNFQRSVLITSPTYTAAAAQTITALATVAIEGAPTVGSNITVQGGQGGLFIDSYAGTATGAASVAALFGIPGIANGIGNTQSLEGLIINSGLSGGQLNVGDQTATTNELFGISVQNFSATSSVNTRTFGTVAGIQIDGFFQQGSNVLFQKNYQLLLGSNSVTGCPATAFQINGSTLTNLPDSTENSDVVFALNRNVSFNTGNISLQRAFQIIAPTYKFAAASTITTAATVFIDNAPTAGTNATIENNFALIVGGGNVSVKNFILNSQQSIAAANDFTVSSNSTYVTGATQINRIAYHPSTQGNGSAMINLIFASNPLIKYNQASGAGFFGIKLAGSLDFQAVANATLTLVWDDTNQVWQELARKVP